MTRPWLEKADKEGRELLSIEWQLLSQLSPKVLDDATSGALLQVRTKDECENDHRSLQDIDCYLAPFCPSVKRFRIYARSHERETACSG
jgi:hypothetical protein